MKEKKEEEQHFFGSAKVGARGQIVIPKEAREIFDINPGDQVLIVGKSGKGLGLMKVDTSNAALQALISSVMESGGMTDEDHKKFHELS